MRTHKLPNNFLPVCFKRRGYLSPAAYDALKLMFDASGGLVGWKPEGSTSVRFAEALDGCLSTVERRMVLDGLAAVDLEHMISSELDGLTEMLEWPRDARISFETFVRFFNLHRGQSATRDVSAEWWNGQTVSPAEGTSMAA